MTNEKVLLIHYNYERMKNVHFTRFNSQFGSAGEVKFESLIVHTVTDAAAETLSLLWVFVTLSSPAAFYTLIQFDPVFSCTFTLQSACVQVSLRRPNKTD